MMDEVQVLGNATLTDAPTFGWLQRLFTLSSPIENDGSMAAGVLV